MRVRRRTVCTALAVTLLAATGGSAHAQSGSITDVHASAGGQHEATFSSTSTECTMFGFCGWFPVAWQVAATSVCAPGGSDIVYVGTYQDTPGTQTTVDSFYKQFEPVKLCLYINVPSGGYQLVAETTYATPPPPPAPPPPAPPPPPPAPVAGPTLVSPAVDAQLPAARSISFRVRSPEAYDLVTVEVSRSTDLDADGTLADADVVDTGFDDFGEVIRLDGGWTRRPGTYYWQASRIACTEDASDCHAESEIRKLEIVEPPLGLTFAAKRRQQLRGPRLGDAFTNLIMRLRCNRACQVRMRGYPTYRADGRRHALRGLGLSESFELRGGAATRYGFRFSTAERARLIAVMRQHGSVRWRMEVRATTDDNDVSRLRRLIQMTPPPLPSPPRPAPAPQPSQPSCDPSYPGVCIPPAPPDLDCDDVPYSDFAVIGSDPHGFDGNDDGVGCES